MFVSRTAKACIYSCNIGYTRALREMYNSKFHKCVRLLFKTDRIILCLEMYSYGCVIFSSASYLQINKKYQ